MCIEAASHLQSARCLLCEVVDYKVHLHVQGAGSLQQQWALMCNGYFWLIWDHFCWQTVSTVLIVLRALQRAEKKLITVYCLPTTSTTAATTSMQTMLVLVCLCEVLYI